MYCFMLIRSRIKVKRYAVININKGFLMFISLLAISISETCGLAITSLTTMLERMERQGLLRREPDSRDKRKTLLFLTDKARALKADYDAVSDQMGALYYQDFTDDEVRQFEEYLQRIQRNLEEKLKS